MSYCKKLLIQSENEYRLVGEDMRNKNLVVVLVVVAQIGKFVKCAGEIRNFITGLNCRAGYATFSHCISEIFRI